MEKIYVRNHCKCPYCRKKIEVVIRPDTQYGMQVWVRKSKDGSCALHS